MAITVIHNRIEDPVNAFLDRIRKGTTVREDVDMFYSIMALAYGGILMDVFQNVVEFNKRFGSPTLSQALDHAEEELEEVGEEVQTIISDWDHLGESEQESVKDRLAHEIADTIYTLLAIAQTADLDYRDVQEALQKVMTKNELKTTKEYIRDSRGKVRRIGSPPKKVIKFP